MLLPSTPRVLFPAMPRLVVRTRTAQLRFSGISATWWLCGTNISCAAISFALISGMGFGYDPSSSMAGLGGRLSE